MYFSTSSIAFSTFSGGTERDKSHKWNTPVLYGSFNPNTIKFILLIQANLSS